MSNSVIPHFSARRTQLPACMPACHQVRAPGTLALLQYACSERVLPVPTTIAIAKR